MRYSIRVVAGDEGLAIGKFAGKDDVLTALAEFLDFYEKNMDMRKIDIVITVEEDVSDGACE